MQNFNILNTREVKSILSMIRSQFGYTGKIDYAFLRNKDDIYIISRDLAKIDTRKFRINSLGLYFGEIKKGILRLSIDATNLIGNDLGKNILILDDEAIFYWLKGDDIPVKTDLKGYVVVKNKQDYLGCGYMKDDVLLNYVPKERRLKTIYH